MIDSQLTLQDSFPDLFGKFAMEIPAAADQVDQVNQVEHAIQPDQSLKNESYPWECISNDQRLEKQIKELEPLHRIRIRQMSQMMQHLPVTIYLSEDGKNVGIIIKDRKALMNKIEDFELFTQTVFGPSHGIICELFKAQLQGVARTHGKQ